MSAVLIIPKGFGQTVKKGEEPAQMQLLIDGTDNAKAGIRYKLYNACCRKSV
jgi:hypothetical protein